MSKSAEVFLSNYHALVSVYCIFFPKKVNPLHLGICAIVGIGFIILVSAMTLKWRSVQINRIVIPVVPALHRVVVLNARVVTAVDNALLKTVEIVWVAHLVFSLGLKKIAKIYRVRSSPTEYWAFRPAALVSHCSVSFPP